MKMPVSSEVRRAFTYFRDELLEEARHLDSEAKTEDRELDRQAKRNQAEALRHCARLVEDKVLFP